MSFDAETLYRLLPAIHRIRDEELGGPLRALIAVIAEQLAVMEENIEQLYDDQFIETCADWVVPYIGDLIGYRPLYGEVLGVGSPRAEVAHTIALRRRKGTAAVLEQLARDVTGWNARAVEFFQTLATTQYMNHVRPRNHYAPDLRQWEPLERIGSAFDTVAHTVDVRRISSRRGRHNIPNVGLFLWPVDAYPSTRSPAVQADPVDARRWRVSPLNHDMPLYNRPESEERITHIAEPFNVPMPLSRRVLDQDIDTKLPALPTYYGQDLSLAVYINGDPTPVPVTGVCVCNLGDDGATWAHLPDSKIAIDPVLGRIALPAAPAAPITRLEVSYHYGFSAQMGGGEYERTASFGAKPNQTVLHVPDDHATIQAALDQLNGDGVVVVTDNGRYEETLTVHVKAGGYIELRSENERRASLVLTGGFTVKGDVDSEFALNGLLVSGHNLHVPATTDNHLARLSIVHTTLVPGWSLNPNGEPAHPGEPSVIVDIADTHLTLTRSIVGGLRTHPDGNVSAFDSVIDATVINGVAFAAPDGRSAGARLSLMGCTAIGKLHAVSMPLISNSLVLAELEAGDGWTAPVLAEQKQTGCVRFSWLPTGSRVPQCYHCLPQNNGYPAPRMMSLRYGTPIYCRLSEATDATIRRGAEDEDEMGAFHHLHATARETNVRLRLAEYLRAGLESGVFFEI
ncbi:hypothetical protein QU481_15605 [Crenobacter sp. SG2303]|uniref:Phage tail protein n=1 Tax=Crenobacter oryzisoli TaxID=3056844 RepID=A0ABT7XR93_9NEIS|nr:hypothetical protein [Crenobacter sp. SG2303]MDN0075081.1 hypothetical protein [Crenobacter sp. SG2303]MDN0076311.1 hypothetical protein [Crenobacter sp. SG2303]